MFIPMWFAVITAVTLIVTAAYIVRVNWSAWRSVVRSVIRINRCSVSVAVGRTRIVITRTPHPSTVAYRRGYHDGVATLVRTSRIDDGRGYGGVDDAYDRINDEMSALRMDARR